MVNDQDQELLEQIQEVLAPRDRALSELKRNMKALMERSSRPPGTSLERAGLEGNQLSLSRQLADDGAFQNWLKAVKTPTSAYAAELRLPPLHRKAAGIISDLSPTQHVPFIYGPPVFPLRLATLLPTIPVISGSIEFAQETSFEPNAAVVPETTLKPTTSITFAEKTAKIATIATVLKASLQALADLPMLQIWLDSRLSYAVALKQENVILNGDAANNITGLMAQATAFAYTPIAADNLMDIIAHAAGALQGQGFAVDGVVMNSTDYTNARLLKSTIGSYLFMGDCSSGPDDETIWESTPLIWQIPTVISPSMPQGQFLIGGFAQSTILFSRETLNVQIAFQNEDDFVHNLVCLRGELRSGVAVPVPAGLLKGSFAGLTAPATQQATPAAAQGQAKPVPEAAHTASSRK